jgi:hypothetical protein
MKRFFFMLVLLTGALAANAQPTYKNEVAVGTGLVATSDLQSIAYRLMAGLMEMVADEESPLESVNSGCNSAEYFHYLGDLVAIGGVIGYHSFSLKQGDVQNAFTSYSLMPAVKLSWYNRDHFSSYSKLALGASLIHELQSNGEAEATNRVSFNGQITFLGVDAGWKRFRIFGEVGFGQQGLAAIGLRYRW